MRGVLKKSRPAVVAQPTGAAAVPGAQPAANPAPPKCGLLTCPRCGLRLETLTLRCPRCRADIPLGCGGNCSTCGKA